MFERLPLPMPPDRSAEGDADVSALEQRFQLGIEAIGRKYELPGMTAAYVLPDDRVVAFAYGLADRETGAPMTRDTRMPTSSVGKTFVAATTLALAQDGKLSLDDKIEKWLGKESWFADLPNGPLLTIRHLLTHRGGLGNHVGDRMLGERARQGLRDFGADFCFPHEELVGFVTHRDPLFEPGRGYFYTDTGYILVGMIIERAGGASYFDQIGERFLRPLQLNFTEPADRRDLANIAAGYLRLKNPWGLPEKTLVDGKLCFNPANEWTGGGLVSNPQDLARWAKLLFEGRVLPKPYVEELVATAPVDHDKTTKYALGVVVSENDFGISYGHGGRFLGYVSHVAYYPEQRVAVAAQVNIDLRPDVLGDVRLLSKEVLEAVDRGVVPSVVVPSVIAPNGITRS